MQNKKILLLLAATSVLIGLEACDDADDTDSTAPSIRERPGISTQQGDVVQARENITFTFSEAIDANAITLSGSLANDVDTSALLLQEGGKIDVSPNNFWSAGNEQSLTISVKDFSGNASQPFTLTVNIPTTLDNGQAASVVLGQVDFNSNIDALAPDQSNFSAPQGSARFFDNTLYLPDTGQNRLLGFSDSLTDFPVDASSQIGQLDFISRDSDYFDAPVAVIKSEVPGVKPQYFIVDSQNHRVLVYDTLPTGIDTPAKFIIGESEPGCSESSLNQPMSVGVAGNRLAVADTGNHRILLWNLPIARQNGPAIGLLGQSNYDSCLVNAGTPATEESEEIPGKTGPRTLNNPTAVISDGVNFLVVDSGNNRAVGWLYLPISEESPLPNYVLGQADFISSKPNSGGVDNPAQSLNQPSVGAHYNGTQLCISDTGNHRVLIWNTLPNSDKTAADVVLGQASMATNDLVNEVSAESLSSPSGCFLSGTQVVVTDTGNHRVLIYDALKPE